MDALTIIAIVLIVVLVVLWIFYNRYTNRIIEELLAENVALQRENELLNGALSVKNLKLSDKPTKPKCEVNIINFPNSEVSHNEN